MEASEIIIVESYSNIKKFLDIFDLNDYKALPIIVNRIGKLPPVYDLHFEEYDVDIEMTPLTFKFNIIVSEFEKENNIRKLNIDVREELFRPELQNCFNHLHRKRNLHYAIEHLQYFIQLFRQRAKLMDYSASRIPDCLSIDYKNENGFVMKCLEAVTKETYFLAKWKIWWNCRTLNFYDYIDFAVNKSYFHAKVRSVMTRLLVPTHVYEDKLQAWAKIYDCVDETNPVNLLANSLGELHVRTGSTDSFDILAAPIEISDSESDEDTQDDDCVIQGTCKVNNNVFVID